jgi:hypothetical protein
MLSLKSKYNRGLVGVVGQFWVYVKRQQESMLVKLTHCRRVLRNAGSNTAHVGRVPKKAIQFRYRRRRTVGSSERR